MLPSSTGRLPQLKRNRRKSDAVYASHRVGNASMPDKDIDRVWELMESVRLCMLSTWDGTEIRSRPMGAFVRRKEGAIYFFTDERAHKDDEIRRYPRVCLAFADTSGQKYVSVSGKARIGID